MMCDKMAEATETVAPIPERRATAGEGGESKTAVLAAMVANFLIAIGKLIAGLMTGSASMLAEAGHSVADTVNQVFLLVGINLSHTTADEKHPMATARKRSSGPSSPRSSSSSPEPPSRSTRASAPQSSPTSTTVPASS